MQDDWQKVRNRESNHVSAFGEAYESPAVNCDRLTMIILVKTLIRTINFQFVHHLKDSLVYDCSHIIKFITLAFLNNFQILSSLL